MPTVGQIERKTQQRVVKLFRDTLRCEYLGNWIDREGNCGTYPETSRTQARKRRNSVRNLVRSGIDPAIKEGNDREAEQMSGLQSISARKMTRVTYYWQ